MDTRVRARVLRWLVWVSAIAATRLLPDRIQTAALVVVLLAFAAWFAYDTWKTLRDLAAHQIKAGAGKRALREALEPEGKDRGLSKRARFDR